MKVKAKNTLREMARYLGIQVKFVSYLADDVHGKLIPREKRVLINASKPRTEHIFTLLHELGHFVLHYQNFPRKYHPWYLEIHWKNKFLAKQSSFARRCLRFYFKRESGREADADRWAMCAFVLLAERVGCWDDLFDFLDQHPEKNNTYWLAIGAITYGGIKNRLRNLSKMLLSPFCIP